MPAKTQAAVLRQIKAPLGLEEIHTPALAAGQVLVRIAYSGLCHSQLNEINGLKGEDKFLPHTLGHEGAGQVEAVGEGVTKVKPGDLVVITWIKGSGADVPGCKYTDASGKQINSGAVSTFLELAVVAENRLVKIRDDMPLKTAALLGCAVPTGAGMVLKHDPQKTLHSVVVFGAGGIGLSAVMAAHYRGVERIIAVDVAEHKLVHAERLGATDLINGKEQNAVEEIRRITNNAGADLAIESAGRRETMEAAFESITANGGACILAGNLPHGQKISIDPLDLIKGKRIVGTWGGGTDPDADIPFYAEAYMSGRLKLDLLVTHEYPLAEINQACSDLQSGKVGRAMLHNN